MRVRPPGRSVARLRGAVALLLCLVLTGCTPDDGTAESASAPTPSGRSSGLLAAMPACDALPQGVVDERIADLGLPAGMVVTDISEVPPLLQVTGMIDATPREIRDRYEGAADVVHVEDEGFEAEILLSRGDHRIFIKATARCRTGSVVSLLRAPGDDVHLLPVPGQLAGS